MPSEKEGFGKDSVLDLFLPSNLQYKFKKFRLPVYFVRSLDSRENSKL